MRVKQAVMVSACRTAIGDFLGSLKDVPARQLAMTAGKAAIERAGIPADMIDEICMGASSTRPCRAHFLPGRWG
jgi:acetyl-CoA C-acetyltransferase